MVSTYLLGGHHPCRRHDRLQDGFAGRLPLANGCHWITNGPKERRNQSVHCLDQAPFTVVGEARVEGDRLCSKFVYPDGSRLEACQEVFRIGDNKYETRIGGAARGVFYRLLR